MGSRTTRLKEHERSSGLKSSELEHLGAPSNLTLCKKTRPETLTQDELDLNKDMK
jgi:hypothetical protein